MNRLGNSTSPYLLQHRDNPVEWWPWSDEAFEEARRTGKPVLLSIGYAACHWCHVMAHESFEDPQIAALMNQLYVNIKVDREERPDIDHVYMSALHSLGEQGGWPLTMFLDGNRAPFWGGTYFPPVSKWGRPGFPTILQGLEKIYREDAGRIAHNVSVIRQALEQGATHMQTATLSAALLAQTGEALKSRLDPINGGLTGAPKFPNASILMLSWRCAQRFHDRELMQLFVHSMDRIVKGGIHDHVGGGFSRYSVDERWLVPHFEKMLYDNAQLLELLALAFHETGEEHFRLAAQHIVDWIKREMLVEGGGFASSLDADSEGEEGRFYVWTLGEVVDVLGEDDGALFARYFDISADGNWEGNAIPNQLDTPTPDAGTVGHLEHLKLRLLEVRNKRIHPGRDDKVLADWNGLMIAALARAATVFEQPQWLTLAVSAFCFISESMADGDGLAHSYREGQLLKPGFASDHAMMVLAACTLTEAGYGDGLGRAQSWARHALDTYMDEERGVLSMTGPNTELLIRPTVVHDDAVPNANGIMIEALQRLATLTGGDAWRQEAEHLLKNCSSAAAASPLGHASVLSGFDFLERCAEIVIAGASAQRLLEAARSTPFPLRTVLDAARDWKVPEDHPVKAQISAAGQGAAFVCAQGRCSLAVHEPDEVKKTLAAMVGRE